MIVNLVILVSSVVMFIVSLVRAGMATAIISIVIVLLLLLILSLLLLLLSVLL